MPKAADPTPAASVVYWLEPFYDPERPGESGYLVYPFHLTADGLESNMMQPPCPCNESVLIIW